MSSAKKALLVVSIIAILIVSYRQLDAFLFNGIRPLVVDESGISGKFYAKAGIQNQACVILLGGGLWGDYWAESFAKEGYAALSLPYAREEGLPALPEEIPLEYFEKVITLLNTQEQVDGKKIIVMGASRNAELALVIAATLNTTVSGAIAFAPSAVTWSNTVLPYNSDSIKASWTFRGEDIPYLAMPKITAGTSSTLNTLDYWNAGLDRSDEAQAAAIPVENINGPVLLFSGADDQIWPSARMADMIVARLKANRFSFTYINHQYNNAGHQISGNPANTNSTQTGQLVIGDKRFEIAFGGSAAGDRVGMNHAREKIFELLAAY